MANPNKVIGYFTMEIGIDDSIPTYCGGLGMLAGDTIKAAADLGLPMVACTLLYRGGYVDQSIDRSGNQKEKAVDWDPDTVLEEMPQRVHVPIEGRTVVVRCYRKIWKGVTGKYVPVYFLDTDLPENTARDRKITERLYIGDDMAKLRQRAVLGIAGPRMLRALTHDVDVYHMNEGHGVLLTMELMSEHLSRFDKQKVDAECVRYSREKCVFTTHTPVPAGHDQFKVADVREVVGDHPAFREPELFATGGKGRTVHASIMALNLSRYANGVAKRHGEVSREMFPGYDIDSVTNGIHAPTWASPYMQAIFDKHFPEWRVRTEDLRMATSIADRPLLDAHANAKRDLMAHVRERTGADVSEERFTITFARRATPYKRPTLFMHDIERLIDINENVHPIQVFFTGKSHPADGKGKDAIHTVLQAARKVKKHFPITWIPNYNMELGAKLTAGSDLWLNNPKPPLEASGTSGMKAALNGVPSLSSLDGWWIEGHSEHVTGWSIDGETETENAKSIYDKLERDILPVYRDDKAYWAEIMRSCIALNGSHFTTIRMLKDYVLKAYLH